MYAPWVYFMPKYPRYKGISSSTQFSHVILFSFAFMVKMYIRTSPEEFLIRLSALPTPKNLLKKKPGRDPATTGTFLAQLNSNNFRSDLLRTTQSRFALDVISDLCALHATPTPTSLSLYLFSCGGNARKEGCHGSLKSPSLVQDQEYLKKVFP